MIQTLRVDQTDSLDRDVRLLLNGKLASYLAASGVMATVATSQSEAAVIGNSNVQPFGVNGVVNIDFNGDGQIDFQIDHDRVDLGGGNAVDYLQLDKNDSTSEINPLAIPGIFDGFPPNGNPLNSSFDPKYVVPTGGLGDYPAALTAGTTIGPASSMDFQEGSGFNGSQIIRANRLIDEDAGQVDLILGGTPAASIAIPTNGPNFLGLGGGVKYLGVQMKLQGDPNPITYGWIGVRIDNEADATGAVVGYAYENTGAPIRAGVVPEPTTILTVVLGVAALFGKRVFGRGSRRLDK
ncbi:MAG: hypothetical protein SH868_08460 [Bythopirellula sp.]|nr:hypothetical protein [Bythopirellula sp.]